MPRQRTGYVYYDKERKSWTARFTYKDEFGRTKNFKRQVANKTEGHQLIKNEMRKLELHGPSVIDGAKVAFKELAVKYREAKLKEPTYEDGVRTSGLRSYKSLQRRLTTLVDHFGSKRVVAITHGDILKYKLKRLRDPNKRELVRLRNERLRNPDSHTEQPEPVSTLKLATVQRELQLLRGVLNFAKREGWIIRNPFDLGEPLISMASEKKRDRIVSREEEASLLAQCEADLRKHLRPILIAALDTGLRKGELLKLRWADVDLIEGLIRLRATTTKTEKPRTVGTTQRLLDELRRLWEASPRNSDALVFGITSDIKKGWKAICTDAKISNLRFHDLRHVATTRLVETKALHTAEAMTITGHSQESTFLRYVNPQDETARRAAEALDIWLAAEKKKGIETEPERSEMIN